MRVDVLGFHSHVSVPTTLSSCLLNLPVPCSKQIYFPWSSCMEQWRELEYSDTYHFRIIFTLMRLIIEHHKRLVYMFILALLIFQVSYWTALGDRIRVFTPKITITNQNAPGLKFCVEISPSCLPIRWGRDSSSVFLALTTGQGDSQNTCVSVHWTYLSLELIWKIRWAVRNQLSLNSIQKWKDFLSPFNDWVVISFWFWNGVMIYWFHAISAVAACFTHPGTWFLVPLAYLSSNL